MALAARYVAACSRAASACGVTARPTALLSTACSLSARGVRAAALTAPAPRSGLAPGRLVPYASETIQHRGFAAAAAASSSGGAAALVDRIKSDMKDAMKAKDQAKLDAIRFLNAAIKQREIEMRESGGAVNDDEVIKVIQKLVKQRKDSIDSYRAGGREDLVAKEQTELSLLEAYLPAMMSAAEVEAVVVQVVAELGAQGPKAMGQVMKGVMAKTGGRADNKTVSDLVKAKLSGK